MIMEKRHREHQDRRRKKGWRPLFLLFLNTLASKSVDSTVTQLAVEMKVLIEQMREQIQNIE